MGTAAFFDLDRTLLPGGSGPVFAAALARLGVKTPSIPGQAFLFKVFDTFGESYIVMQLARQAVSRTKGLDRALVQASAEIAADELLERVQPYVASLLAEHRAAGDLLVLATTSPFDLVSPLARRLGFDAVVATRYAENEGVYTGELDGPFVWGLGKLAAVKTWASVHDIDLGQSAAYSDSVFDAPLLGAVGRPVAVNPDPRLRLLAAAKRWPIRALDAPKGVPVFNGVEPFDVFRFLARPELFRFAKFRFEGTENIPRTGPVIIAANHRSYFDPLAIGLAIAQVGRNGRFMGKKEVFDAPVVGQFAKAMGAIRVDRGSGSNQPLLEAAAALDGGEAVVILPQGTIPRGSAFFEPQLEGRSGVARLAAMRPDVPVIPLGVWGTEQVWPRSSKVPLIWNIGRAPVVSVGVGKPIKLTRNEPSTGTDVALVMQAIMDQLPPESRLRRIVTEADLAATVPDGDLSKVRSGGPRADAAVRKQRTTNKKPGANARKALDSRHESQATARPVGAAPKPTARTSKSATSVAKPESSARSARLGSTKSGAPSRRLNGSLADR